MYFRIFPWKLSKPIEKIKINVVRENWNTYVLVNCLNIQRFSRIQERKYLCVEEEGR